MDIPAAIKAELAARAKARRLLLALTQEGLAKRAGVSLGALKIFERSGRISLDSLLKLALALEALEDFKILFVDRKPAFKSLDDVLHKPKARQRGRIK